MNWKGVLPAITTPLCESGEVDHGFLARHVSWLAENGCSGVVALGSLGEGATLRFEEKVQVLETLVSELGDAPTVAGISALSTSEGIELAQAAERVGCQGLMVLPPYVYSTDWREMKAHVAAICSATSLSCMIYNNPIAYKTDFLALHIEELADEFENVHAVKESSSDARRVTALKARLGDKLEICVGVDDVLVEGIAAGATGWVAGLVNALPRESVQLYELAMAGKTEAAFEIYKWFLPLLELDTVPKFVQLIKLTQQEAGCGHECVRAPRLVLEGAEREAALKVIREGLSNRPATVPSSTPFEAGVTSLNGARAQSYS
jgi:dihydrodipicolinate synthase/N-acetylneuraminate lyase